MSRFALLLSVGLLMMGSAHAAEPARASASPTAEVATSTAPPQVCQDASEATCTQPPAWQAELDKAQKSWSSCQKEIDQFCEGVQVGEGRLENCLKTHQKKLSSACRKAQGLK